MGITASNKVIDRTQIDCEGRLRVTLALTAAPNIISSPTDIVLILDRSGSMQGAPLASMKLGCNTFIDIIAEATGGAATGEIGSGSRMGVVSFADNARVDAPLITSVETLKNAVDGLAAGGTTNHAAAFEKALGLFDPASSNAKVMVMFTDGNTTAGGPPAPIAQAAKDQGVVIYCIGLIGSSGLDVDALNTWASLPTATHVAVTPDAADLEALFAALAANISKPGATNIRIEEEVESDFIILSMLPPTKGTAEINGPRTLTWTIDQLGVTAGESAILEFFVRHVGQTPGTKPVNASITYSDDEDNVVNFPDPTVEVICDVVVNPEPCPVPVDFTSEGCSDIVVVDAGDVYLDAQGRIIQLSATIKKVCPRKRVALAVILTEVDDAGNEYQRGMKAFTIPAHTSPSCRDIKVKNIRFIVPEDLNVSGNGMCSQRSFKARLFANTIDNDYICIDSDTDSNP